MTREEVHIIANDVKKTYSKDYFEGMKQFANIILGELGDVAEYYDDMSRTYKGEEYYSNLEEGIGKAMDVVEKILYMQLAVKGDEEK